MITYLHFLLFISVPFISTLFTSLFECMLLTPDLKKKRNRLKKKNSLINSTVLSCLSNVNFTLKNCDEKDFLRYPKIGKLFIWNENEHTVYDDIQFGKTNMFLKQKCMLTLEGVQGCFTRKDFSSSGVLECPNCHKAFSLKQAARECPYCKGFILSATKSCPNRSYYYYSDTKEGTSRLLFKFPA